MSEHRLTSLRSNDFLAAWRRRLGDDGAFSKYVLFVVGLDGVRSSRGGISLPPISDRGEKSSFGMPLFVL